MDTLIAFAGGVIVGIYMGIALIAILFVASDKKNGDKDESD